MPDFSASFTLDEVADDANIQYTTRKNSSDSGGREGINHDKTETVESQEFLNGKR